MASHVTDKSIEDLVLKIDALVKQMERNEQTDRDQSDAESDAGRDGRRRQDPSDMSILEQQVQQNMQRMKQIPVVAQLIAMGEEMDKMVDPL